MSTVNLTPTPKGQPLEVNTERVPTDDNSMMVLDISAGNGLSFETPTRVLTAVGSETMESEQLRENLRGGVWLKWMNWGLAMVLKAIKGGRKWGDVKD